MVTDWKTILSLPLKAAPNACPPPSVLPRMLVTSSSRVSSSTTMPGATPETVFTTRVGSGRPTAGLADDEVLAGEEDEAAQHQHLVHQRVDDAAERALHLPPPGEVAVEEVGEQGDGVDDERAVEQPRVAAALVLVERELHEEDRRQHAAGPAVSALGTWRNMGRGGLYWRAGRQAGDRTEVAGPACGAPADSLRIAAGSLRSAATVGLLRGQVVTSGAVP